MRKNKFFTPKQMVMLALLASIAYLIVSLIRIPVVLFLKYEPKDVIITIGGFLFGPMASFVVSLLVSLIEMVTISETGPIGAVMNLLSTCCFACTASYIYKKNRTLKGAILALVIGSILMTAAMVLWNWLITPLYMGVDRITVQGMLLTVFMPFNLLKAGLNTAFVLFLYKPLVNALRKTGLVESREQVASSGNKMGASLLGILLLATCILLLLVFQGKI